MITLLILALASAGLLFAGVPVVAFALMLETCAERAAAGADDVETTGVRLRQDRPTVRPSRALRAA